MKDNKADFFKNLFIFARAILEKERKALKCCGLSVSDYLVLSSVHGAHDRKMTDIAKELFVSRPLVTYAVDRLVQRGLIERSHSKNSDRRIVLLAMTPRARRLFKTIRKKQMLLIGNSLNELPEPIRKSVSFFSQIVAFSEKGSAEYEILNKKIEPF